LAHKGQSSNVNLFISGSGNYQLLKQKAMAEKPEQTLDSKDPEPREEALTEAHATGDDSNEETLTNDTV